VKPAARTSARLARTADPRTLRIAFLIVLHHLTKRDAMRREKALAEAGSEIRM